MAWEESEFVENRLYVAEQYQSSDDGAGRSGDTDRRRRDRRWIARTAGSRSRDGPRDRRRLDQQGVESVVSPLSVMATAAEDNESFAATLESADTDDDGFPDRDRVGLRSPLSRSPREGGAGDRADWRRGVPIASHARHRRPRRRTTSAPTACRRPPRRSKTVTRI